MFPAGQTSQLVTLVRSSISLVLDLFPNPSSLTKVCPRVAEGEELLQRTLLAPHQQLAGQSVSDSDACWSPL